MQLVPIRNEQFLNQLKNVDRTRNLSLMYLFVLRILNDYGYGLQQIEITLRDHRCWTYLIARKNSSEDQIEIKLPDGARKTYYLFISNLKESEAYQEVLKESQTYQENFCKLAQTGFKYRNASSVHNPFASGSIVISHEELLRILCLQNNLDIVGVEARGLILSVKKNQPQTMEYNFCNVV